MRVVELTEQEVVDITVLVAEAGHEGLKWFRPGCQVIQPGLSANAGAATPLEVENKLASSGGFDPVTEADRFVEHILRQALASMFPNDAITGEEFGAGGSGRRRWFIDPIDGTRAFVSGQPMWGTLLGLVVDGSPVAGWMHLPVLNETYVGLPNQCRMVVDGALSTNVKTVELKTTATDDLEEAVLLSTDPSMFSSGSQLDRFERLGSAVKLRRYSGDCMNYGLLASGDVDLVVENQLAPYDIIPLIPIVTGAGGVITNLDGEVPVDGGYVVAAATKALHQAALDLLRP